MNRKQYRVLLASVFFVGGMIAPNASASLFLLACSAWIYFGLWFNNEEDGK